MHVNTSEIFKIIKANYEILKKGILDQIKHYDGEICETEERH